MHNRLFYRYEAQYIPLFALFFLHDNFSLLQDACGQVSIINILCDTKQSTARILEYDLASVITSHIQLNADVPHAERFPVAILDCSQHFQLLNVIKYLKHPKLSPTLDAATLHSTLSDIHMYFPSSFADLESLCTELIRFPPVVYHRIYICGFVSSWFFKEKGKGRYGNGTEYQIPSLLKQLIMSHRCPLVLLRESIFPSSFWYRFKAELERHYSSKRSMSSKDLITDVPETLLSETDFSYIHTQLTDFMDYRLTELVSKHVFVQSFPNNSYYFCIFPDHTTPSDQRGEKAGEEFRYYQKLLCLG